MQCFLLVVVALIYVHIAAFLEMTVRSVYFDHQPLSADKCFDVMFVSCSMSFGVVIFELVVYSLMESASVGNGYRKGNCCDGKLRFVSWIEDYEQ